MSWCPEHKTYSAKREPSGLCGRCWQLFFYKNPEHIEVLKRTYQEAETILTQEKIHEATTEERV